MDRHELYRGVSWHADSSRATPMIIVVKIAARGDLLLAAAAFRQLRHQRPTEHIVLVVGRSCRDVAEHLPYFDEIRTIDDAALFGRSVTAKLRGAWQLLRALRPGRRAARVRSWTVMILHRDWRYAALAWLAGAAERRGFASGPSRAFLTHTSTADPREHHAVQYLRVVCDEISASADRGPLWRFGPGERSAAFARARENGFADRGRPLVALGFGGGHNVKMAVDLKQWPVESFRALARSLSQEGYDVLWFGDAADERRLGADAAGVVLAGKLTVPETVAVLSRCSLAIANDTMLLHAAEALGVPALGIFGPTDPAQTRPLSPRSDYIWLGPGEIPCAPCHQDGHYPPCLHDHRCMRSLTVERVLVRARMLLTSRAEVGSASVAHA